MEPEYKAMWGKAWLAYYLIALFMEMNKNQRVQQNYITNILYLTTFWLISQGNLGWAYMQKSNYMAAEVVYKKAQMIDPDANKACNLALCLIKQARNSEARSILNEVLQGNIPGSEDCKAQNRAQELMVEVEPRWLPPSTKMKIARFDLEDDLIDGLEKLLNEWAPSRTKRLPIFEEISSYRNQLAC